MAVNGNGIWKFIAVALFGVVLGALGEWFRDDSINEMQATKIAESVVKKIDIVTREEVRTIARETVAARSPYNQDKSLIFAEFQNIKKSLEEIKTSLNKFEKRQHR